MFYHIKVLSRLQSKGRHNKGQNALPKALTLCFYQSIICQEEGKGSINTHEHYKELAKPRNYNTDTKSCILLHKNVAYAQSDEAS